MLPVSLSVSFLIWSISHQNCLLRYVLNPQNLDSSPKIPGAFIPTPQTSLFCFPLHYYPYENPLTFLSIIWSPQRKDAEIPRPLFIIFRVSYILCLIYLPLAKCLLLWGFAFIFTSCSFPFYTFHHPYLQMHKWIIPLSNSTFANFISDYCSLSK